MWQHGRAFGAVQSNIFHSPQCKMCRTLNILWEYSRMLSLANLCSRFWGLAGKSTQVRAAPRAKLPNASVSRRPECNSLIEGRRLDKRALHFSHRQSYVRLQQYTLWILGQDYKHLYELAMKVLRKLLKLSYNNNIESFANIFVKIYHNFLLSSLDTQKK